MGGQQSKSPEDGQPSLQDAVESDYVDQEDSATPLPGGSVAGPHGRSIPGASADATACSLHSERHHCLEKLLAADAKALHSSRASERIRDDKFAEETERRWMSCGTQPSVEGREQHILVQGFRSAGCAPSELPNALTGARLQRNGQLAEGRESEGLDPPLVELMERQSAPPELVGVSRGDERSAELARVTREEEAPAALGRDGESSTNAAPSHGERSKEAIRERWNLPRPLSPRSRRAWRSRHTTVQPHPQPPPSAVPTSAPRFSGRTRTGMAPGAASGVYRIKPSAELMLCWGASVVGLNAVCWCCQPLRETFCGWGEAGAVELQGRVCCCCCGGCQGDCSCWGLEWVDGCPQACCMAGGDCCTLCCV